jgi:hypothetical protein
VALEMSRRLLLVIALLPLGTAESYAQRVDITAFVGHAYPVYGERLRFTPSLPVFPRVSVRESGPLEITSDGGAVFGGAVAVEFGIVAVEARFDAVDLAFSVTGTRYDLVATAPTTTTIGSVGFASGRLDVERLNLRSLNVRLRTPGPVGLVASGGVSYLPGVTIEGRLPVTVEAPGILSPSSVNARVQLIATPGEREHRWGLNGGAGVRLGGDHLALLVEARLFYFRAFDLELAGVDGPDFLNAVVDGIPPVRFEPIIVNAHAGIVFRF